LARVVIEPKMWMVNWSLRYREAELPEGYEVTWRTLPLFVDTYEAPVTDDPAGEYATRLVQGLANSEHTLKLIPNGDGAVLCWGMPHHTATASTHHTRSPTSHHNTITHRRGCVPSQPSGPKGRVVDVLIAHGNGKRRFTRLRDPPRSDAGHHLACGSLAPVSRGLLVCRWE
jgi:hypothetical protein